MRKGDVAHIAPKAGIHAAKNGSSSEPARALVFIVAEKGKPLAEPAK